MYKIQITLYSKLTNRISEFHSQNWAKGLIYFSIWSVCRTGSLCNPDDPMFQWPSDPAKSGNSMFCCQNKIDYYQNSYLNIEISILHILDQS